MRVAIIHYWLVNWRGGERVLKAICDLFPEADIYTHVADPEIIKRELRDRNVHTTFIARLPGARRHYQKYLPLMPLALEQLDLRRYDLVISSESGPAKGVIISPHALHVCYCHSPMRYVWDMYHEYHSRTRGLVRVGMAPLTHYLRLWDQVSSQRVDHYIANSAFVATRIAKFYRRDADVIHPPVATDAFDATRKSEDFYLSIGQLVAYKRPDLLVEAFNRSGRPLVIVGDGDLLNVLRRNAKSNIQVLGHMPFATIRDLYARCRALVFPGIEDFGIVPLEAMASGKPVIAFAAGGALETVIDGKTGVFFKEPTLSSLNEAIVRLEETYESYCPQQIRAHSLHFSESVFRDKMHAYFERVVGEQIPS